MSSLIIEGTEDTPSVEFIPDSGYYHLSGRSLPEDVLTFYQPIMAWLGQFAMSETAELTLQVKLEYFNTASSKVLLDIFLKMEDMQNDGKKVFVIWHHGAADSDMLEAGEEYSDLVNIPFSMISY